MTEQAAFQEKFAALDVPARAALVFWYRERLPLDHVAKLVERSPERVERDVIDALAELRRAGVLPRPPATEDELCQWLDKLRDEPELSTFALVAAVRAGRARRGRFSRRAE
ncbi:hypothetical protein GCM10009839_40800 [Catenulispora yoronensis]|uniref:RNA polymerase sigma factor 70 region 4 type 2 domain-containing protein n=1 Tax=Catenulispora yoronensis TaxID=450799 RepID=A0ABP5FXA1_9ACTN